MLVFRSRPLLFVAASAAYMTVYSPVLAQDRCGPTWDAVIAALAARSDGHDEHPVHAGIAEDGRLMTMLATKDGKTWTIIKTVPSGETCIVDFGTDLAETSGWSMPPNGPQS